MGHASAASSRRPALALSRRTRSLCRRTLSLPPHSLSPAALALSLPPHSLSTTAFSLSRRSNRAPLAAQSGGFRGFRSLNRALIEP